MRIGITPRAGLIALAAVAACSLAGCGDGDSTATSTPTLNTTPALRTLAPSSSAQQSAVSSAAQTPATSPGPSFPRPAEAPAPPSSGFPGPAQPPPPPRPGSKEQAYLDELKKQGITPTQKENALTIASVVCQGVKEGKTDQQIAQFVNAMADADGGGLGPNRTAEQAGQTYITVARTTYCK